MVVYCIIMLFRFTAEDEVNFVSPIFFLFIIPFVLLERFGKQNYFGWKCNSIAYERFRDEFRWTNVFSALFKRFNSIPSKTFSCVDCHRSIVTILTYVVRTPITHCINLFIFVFYFVQSIFVYKFCFCI